MLNILLISALTAFFVVLLLHGFLPWSKTCVCSSASTMDNSLKFAALGDSWKSIARQRRVRLETGTKFTKKANDGRYYNFRPLMLIGMYSDVDLYLPDDGQDLAGWTTDLLKRLCPNMPATDVKVVTASLETPLFKDINFHSTMQQELKAAVDDIAFESFVGARYQQLQLRVDNPADLYMGSRAIADLEQALREHAEDHRVDILTDTMDPIRALKNEALKPDQLFAVISEVENSLDITSIIGHQDRLDSEKLVLSEILKSFKAHSDERVRKIASSGVRRCEVGKRITCSDGEISP